MTKFGVFLYINAVFFCHYDFIFILLYVIVGKSSARIALKRLQKLAEQVFPESKCGFRAQRSTTNLSSLTPGEM